MSAGTIEVFRIPVPKVDLSRIPADERTLLLLASHAVNQMTTLIRLLTFSVNHHSDSELENLLSAGQSQTILRYLLGTTAETWQMLKRSGHQNIIGQDYIKTMPAEAVASYAQLRKLFGKSNLLHRIRNRLAFHYPDADSVEKAFQSVPENEDWAWYAAPTYHNSFYLASDYIISSGIIAETGEADVAKAFERVMSEVAVASNELTGFLSHLMGAIVSRHLGASILSPKAGSGTIIAHAPGLRSFSIPFFTVDDR